MEQCLNDYGIPLYLSHTVTAVHGDNRLTGVTVSRVDEDVYKRQVLTTAKGADGRIHIDMAVAQECIQKRAVRYDKNGDNH